MKKSSKKIENVETATTLLKNSDAADFEEAITATKFGKFNLLLILISIPSGWSSIFEATTMSYVFPAAQCDLNLTLDDKGLLNAVTYAGMISSAFIWGYLCDTLGRKKVLFIGFLLDAIFVVICSSSQTFAVLMTAKFFGGFIINGPFAALTSYLSEFHCAKYRARVQMVLGTILSAGTLVLPLLAGVIFPAEIDFELFGYLRIHSWNVYLLTTALSPFLGACVFFFLPESPKFLMTKGDNAEALRVFQLVYRINTGNPVEMYPIKKLVDERKLRQTELDNKQNVTNNHQQEDDAKTNAKKALPGGWSQLKPLFFPPFLQKIILVCCLQMLFMMSINTLRLWLPQVFQAISDYQFYNNGTSADLCTMLDVIRPKNVTASSECVVILSNTQVYINSMIVAIVGLFGYALAGSLINFLGKKRLLCIIGATAGISGFGLYFAQTPLTTLILSSIYIGVGSISVNVVLSVVVDMFPTTLRTMTVSLTMMLGRIGGMGGNLVFPFLLKTGCAPPFFTVGTGMICCAIFSLFLPNTDMTALK